MEFLLRIRYAFWGPFTILLILATGIYLTCRTHFVQFQCIPWLLKQIRNREEHAYAGISPLQALATSLGGTLGVGNLAGVAAAITLGGPGAVFYMLLAAFFGMATKFSEILLAVRFRTKQAGELLGGPMVYLSKGAYHPLLAKFFCICCILASLGTGAMAQASAITEAVHAICPLSPILIGGILTVLAYPILTGGNHFIAKTAEIIVPFMTILYISGAVIVLFVCRDRIVPSLISIVEGAFQPLAAGGGVLGILTSHAVSDGFSKGVFSNEAGMGSAPIAHGCADCKNPYEEGMLGAIEVFLDTCVVCLLTALVILSSGVLSTAQTGLVLTTSAFSQVFGGHAPIFICITVCFLAFSTIIGWSFYGSACLRYLTGGKHGQKLYVYGILLAMLLSSLLPLDQLLLCADIAAALMSFPNLIGLWTLAPIVQYETARYRHQHTPASKS